MSGPAPYDLVMATGFQRARSDEQRAARSQAILDAAASMLEEMTVAELSLNALSRRVGLAKSNVLRYFDSREAVLLELLYGLLREWVAHLADELPGAVDRQDAFVRRAEQLAQAIAASLEARPVLCDLISTQAAVLEHNVSVEAVTTHKLRGLEQGQIICGLILDALPELSEDDAWKYLLTVWTMASAFWPLTCAPEALVQAYAADERLARTNVEFADALADSLTTVAVGLHARATL